VLAMRFRRTRDEPARRAIAAEYAREGKGVRNCCEIDLITKRFLTPFPANSASSKISTIPTTRSGQPGGCGDCGRN
jgi:hypothetical protein